MTSALSPLHRLGDLALYRIVTDAPYLENCYIARREKDGKGSMVVFDPGSAAGRIVETIRALGGTVEAILLTHGHPDHIAALAEVAEKTGAPVYAHSDEQALLDDAPKWGRALLGHVVEVPPVEYFEGAPTLDLLGGIRVIPTPGHTLGGVCYILGGDGSSEAMAITGDTLFQYGVGRTDFPGGNEATLVASITRFLAEMSDSVLFYPGHGEPWTIGEARRWWKSMS